MISNPWAAFRGKRVMLLQGPVGPFFRRLSSQLKAAGAEVHKINFNGGDCLFYPTKAIQWRGSMDAWPDFFESQLQRLNTDIVLLFGDCRPIHRVAHKIASERGVNIGAFEEGYVRPNFITFERFGVNGYSQIPRAPEFYRVLPCSAPQPEHEVGNTFWHAALWAVLYYAASTLARPWFPDYRHHRPLTPREAIPWIRSAWRKLFYRWRERTVLSELTGPLRRKFFLVPLQMSADSQVSEHSHFGSVPRFIHHVVASFAAHAPRETTLVIKHHPLDRGYHDYRRLLARLARECRLGQRLKYIHDQHLPTLFDNMLGCVVINSTVGFSALSHGAPLKICGSAIYDIAGLTFQGSLDDFWRQAPGFHPDPDLFQRFRTHLIARTQVNASFYRGRHDARISASATAWALGYAHTEASATDMHARARNYGA